MKNKLLQQALDALEGQLAPQFREPYARFVSVGIQAGAPMLKGIEKRGDPIRDAAQGAVNLVFMLAMHATGKPPEQAMVAASYALMLQALQFLEDAKIARIGKSELTRATQVWSDTMLQRGRVTPSRLNWQKERVEGILNDPTKLEMLNLATGYSKDPRAAQPMEMPAEAPPPRNRRERRAAARAAAGRV